MSLIPKSLVRLVSVSLRKTIYLLEKVSLLKLRNISDLGQKCGTQVSGFRRTLEVEHEIVPNREERLKPFDLFRAVHIFFG